MRHILTDILLATSVVLVALGALDAADAQKKPKRKAITPAKVDLGRPVDFQKDIAPILEANCVACHNAAIDESKLSVEDVKSILKGGKRGPAVVPKQPEKSRLYLFASRSQAPGMPPLPNKVDARALTPKEVGLIRQWILEGAATGSGSKGVAVNFSPIPPNLQAIYSVALSPTARFAAAGRANQIVIYDLVTGREAGRLIDPALSPLQFENRPMYPGGAAHRDFVHALKFSPDGTLLASGGYRTVKLWQRQSGSKRFAVSAAGPIRRVAVSPDGKWAAVASADHSLLLVELPGGKLVRKLAGHTGPVNGAAFSPDGSKLVSASDDKTIRLWDVAKGTPIRKLTVPAAVNDVIFNKDASQIITADADKTIRIWNAAASPAPKKADAQKQPAPPRPLRELKGHSQPVTSLALILPAGTQIVSGSADGTVRLWNLSNGQNTRSMNHGAPVSGVAARPDGQMVCSVAANGTGKLWRTTNGQQVAELKGSLDAIETLARRLEDQAVGKQLVALRTADVKTEEKNVQDRESALKKAQDAKTAADKALADAEKKARPFMDALAKAKAELAKNPKDKKLQQKVSQAQKAAQKPEADLQKAQNTKDAADRSLKLALASVTNAKGRLEQAKKTQQTREQQQKQVDAEVKAAQSAVTSPFKPLSAVAFSPDGKTLVTAGQDGFVRLWNAESGEPLDALRTHSASVTSVSVTPAGRILTGSTDKTAALWSVEVEWKLVARLGVAEGNPLDVSNSPFADRVLSLAFSRDGKLLATGGGEPSRSGELFIWDVAKRVRLREIPDAHSDTILGLQFNWEGTEIVSGAADRFAKIFDVATGKLVRSFEGHTHHVLDVAWQADGSTIVSAGADNVLKIWNARTGEQKRSVGGFGKQVTCVQFIGIGPNFVAASGDQRVQFHRTSNGQAYRRFSGMSGYVYCVAAGRSAASAVANINGEATIVVAGGEDGILRVWNGNAQSIKNFEPPKPLSDVKTQASVNGKAAK